MKINNLNIADDKLVLLGALGLLVYGAMPAYEAAVKNSEITLLDENGEPVEEQLPAKSNYIKMTADILSYNNYSPIKTLYKLQNVMHEINELNNYDALNTASKVGISEITDLLFQVKPFLKDNKLDTVNEVISSLDKTKRTVKQVKGIKTRIADLPEETPKGERIKTLLEELPSISGIPILENFGDIKSLLDVMKPLSKNSSRSADSEDSQEKVNYEDIYSLVELLENKNAE